MVQELNIGGSLVSSALEEACGTNRTKLKEMYNKIGDLGSDECFFLIYYIWSAELFLSVRFLYNLRNSLFLLKVMLLKNADKHKHYLPLLRHF